MKLFLVLFLINFSLSADTEVTGAVETIETEELAEETIELTEKEIHLANINTILSGAYELSFLDQTDCQMSMSYTNEEVTRTWEFNYRNIDFGVEQEELILRCLDYDSCMDSVTESIRDGRGVIRFTFEWMLSTTSMDLLRSEELIQSLTDLASSCELEEVEEAEEERLISNPDLSFLMTGSPR